MSYVLVLVLRYEPLLSPIREFNDIKLKENILKLFVCGLEVHPTKPFVHKLCMRICTRNIFGEIMLHNHLENGMSNKINCPRSYSSWELLLCSGPVLVFPGNWVITWSCNVSLLSVTMCLFLVLTSHFSILANARGRVLLYLYMSLCFAHTFSSSMLINAQNQRSSRRN